MKETNGVTHCVQKAVANCSLSEDVDPFNCIECSKGYYEFNGACIQVPTENLIIDCEVYENEKFCKTCSEISTLSLDKLICIKDPKLDVILGSSCKISKVVTSYCNSCMKGYIMDSDGKCSKCADNTLEQGCYVCDPYDNSNCIICSPGFY